jgi:hypothetical protein
MSNAFTNFLSSFKPLGNENRPSLIGAEANAKLIGVPNNVKQEVLETRRPVRVQGEVIQTKADGTVRVRTDRGDVEFKPAEGQRIPKEGQQIEIEIPPNVNAKKSPELVAYRKLPDPAPAPEQQGRPSGTPVEVDVRPTRPQTGGSIQITPPSTQPANPQQPLPPEGETVQLQPLSPEVQTALPPFEPLEQLAAVLTPISETQLQVILQNAQTDLDTALQTLQTPKAAIIQTITPLITTDNPLLQTVPSAAPQTPLPLQTSEFDAVPEIPLAQKQETLPTLLKNFLPENLNKLTAQVMQKIAFGSLQPSIQIPSTQAPVVDGAQVQQTLPQPAQTPLPVFNVTVEGNIIPAIQITPQGYDAQKIANQGEHIKNALKPENIILENQKAGTITGVVTNITQGKLPVISVLTPQGSEQFFALQFPSPHIAVGTHIQITPQSIQMPNPNTQAQILSSVLPLPVQLAPQPWPLMDEIYQTLAQTSPQTAQAFANTVPSPANPAQMSPAILFFIAAVRGGDLSQWLSEKTVDILKGTGKTSLLSRLTQEGAGLNRIASEPFSQEWRAVNLPMFAQGEMQKLALYYRHEHDGENEYGGKSLKSTRFVFDMKLDVMGPVQVDGLFRPVSEAGKRLDVVVRTEQFFSQATQAEMRRVYARALRDTEVTGELSFQNRPETWVSVNAENKPALGVSA